MVVEPSASDVDDVEHMAQEFIFAFHGRRYGIETIGLEFPLRNFDTALTMNSIILITA